MYKEIQCFGKYEIFRDKYLLVSKMDKFVWYLNILSDYNEYLKAKYFINSFKIFYYLLEVD